MKIQTIETEQELLLDEIVSGLSKPQKMLPSKLFYDEKGSQLFDKITQLDEYYLTRTELQIMRENIDDIASFIGKKKVLLELGSGSSIKIRLLIEHLHDLAAYIPVDISEKHLKKSTKSLQMDYPQLEIIPVIADYTQWFSLPHLNKEYDAIDAYYPGSTIGNFTPMQARDFLKRIRSICGENGGLLIGVDLKKDKQILHNAYNDRKGVTAEFNLNILNHINNLFDADFNPDNFRHHAFYNESRSRIEMNLISRGKQNVSIEGNSFSFDKNEKIITEYSYKYSIHEFSELLKDVYEIKKIWSDKNNYFSVQFLKAV